MNRTSLTEFLSRAIKEQNRSHTREVRVIRKVGKKVNWKEIKDKIDGIDAQQIAKQDILEALGLARRFSASSGLTVADVIGATATDLKSIIMSLSVVNRLALVEALATELRRINEMAADAEGVSNETARSLTSGEAEAMSKDFVGLGMPGAASTQQVLPVQAAIERALQATLDFHEQAQRNAPVNDGNISDPRGVDGFPLARNVPRTLDQLEKWAEARMDMAEQLNYFPDDDGGASALGIRPSNQRMARRIEKSSVSLPVDSWTGNTQPLAERLVKQQEVRYEVESTGALPWYMKSRH